MRDTSVIHSQKQEQEMIALRDLDKEKEFIEALDAKNKKADADQYIWSYMIKAKI